MAACAPNEAISHDDIADEFIARKRSTKLGDAHAELQRNWDRGKTMAIMLNNPSDSNRRGPLRTKTRAATLHTRETAELCIVEIDTATCGYADEELALVIGSSS